jgi:hypothetical protein
MEKKSLKILLCLMVFFFLLPRTASAAAPNINSPTVITLDESFAIQASMSGLSKNTTYRLRTALAKPDTTNYFGSTYNGTDWYHGSPAPIDYSEFLSIITSDDGSWSGDITGKVESGDPKYENIGIAEYDLKVGRYTQTGSTATWSNVIRVTLIASAPTPTPTDEPTPTKTPTPTKSQIFYLTPTGQALGLSATNALSKKTATKTAAPKDIPSPILKANDAFEKKTPDKKTVEVLVEGVSRNNFHLIALGIGVLTLSCAILFFIKIKMRQTL